MKQKTFKFNFNKIDDHNNFYVNSTNSKAYNETINQNVNNLLLIGPNKSGKSFLGSIWIRKFDGILYQDNFHEIIQCNKNILIDNLHLKHDQEKIFHIINHINTKLEVGSIIY